jgi:clan AA aspartic protease
MGIVKVNGLIGRSEEELTEVEFLVDTGGFYTALPAHLRDELRLIPGASGLTQLADSSIVEVELTWAYLKLNGREGVVPVEVMNVPEPMLGVTALEALGMKVNPVSRELEIVSPFKAPPTVTQFRPPVK